MSVELEPKIESGELSLSNISQARVAIRAHERETQTKVSVERKNSLASVSTDSPTPPAKSRAKRVDQNSMSLQPISHKQASSKLVLRRRDFPVQIKRKGWQKANGQCEFVSGILAKE